MNFEKAIEKALGKIKDLRRQAKTKAMEEKWPQWVKFHEGQVSGIDQALDEIAKALGWDPDEE